MPAALAILCLLLVGVAPPAALARQHAPPTSGDTDTPASFTLTIPGTSTSIELRRVPARAESDDAPPLAAFYMGATEITWDAYDAFVYAHDADVAEERVDAITRPSPAYVLADRGFGHEGYPVISVNHEGARAFCAWLSAHTGLSFRLPTTDEWSWACRGGARGRWQTGDDPDGLEHFAWFRKNADRATHPVGAKSPNGYGLHDMHGNAAEWAIDDDGAPVVCGGSYRESAAGVAADSRLTPTPAWNASDPQIPKSRWWLADGGFIGFRVVCDAAPRTSEAASPGSAPDSAPDPPSTPPSTPPDYAPDDAPDTPPSTLDDDPGRGR